MSNVRILVHAVWGTHNREPILIKSIRDQLYTHIKENAKTKDVYIVKIGGYHDHIHCLISMGAKQDIALILQLIKGEVSFWANKNNILSTKLRWAKDYFAVSINEDSLNGVCNYINNQEEHHKKVSFKEEYEGFLKRYGFPINKA